MSIFVWIIAVVLIALAGAGIVAVIKMAEQLSNNHDDKDP